MLWVALYCSSLALDRIQRRLPEALSLPVAVCQSHGSKRWINLVNQAGSENGITPGQPVATALALCPHILLLDRDEADEQKALNETALVCLRYTPSVHVTREGLILEVSSSVRLFGGRRALLTKIQQSVGELGLHPSIGIAPTAHGAWLLARSVASKQIAIASSSQLMASLDGLPLHLLDASHQSNVLGTLNGIGCKRLGDLRALPRAGVARRFGPELLAEMDRAYVPCAELYDWFEAPLYFHSKLELIARVETSEALVFASQRLMAQLAGWLSARHAAVGRLTLSLHHERWRPSDQALTTLVIGLSIPSTDPEHLLGLLRERLGQLVLTAPVEELSLSADEVTQADAANQELFPTVQSTSVSLNRLIEKLTARLGSEAVTRVHSRSDHRPEKAWASISAAAKFPRTQEKPVAARPTWLMQQPEALRMAGHRPVYGSPLALLCGPERIESGWWDDALIERDYFIAENESGQLLWVYRERHAQAKPAQWYLHGLFA